jgi:hypothetical protein
VGLLRKHITGAAMLDREPVSSSVIAAIGYDEEREVLEVEFTSGTVYRYLRVSLDLFQAPRASSSTSRSRTPIVGSK